MKKLAALLLALLMVFPTFAMAEENVIVFDPASIEGMNGEFVPLTDFGLQFFCPEGLLVYEVDEESAAAGTYALLGTEDMSFAMTIGYAVVPDAEGNPLTDLESLAAYYTANGVTDVSIGTINDIACLSYSTPDGSTMGVLYTMESGAVLTFNFAPVTDENVLAVAGLIASSIMVAE